MNQWTLFGFAFLALFLSQVSCAVSRVDVSVSINHPNQIKNTEPEKQQRFAAVTEPAWVTELLGPSEAPTTTKRPSLPDRIRNTIVTGIQQVGNTINEIPTRITQIFQGIQQGATNIIRRPTTKPANNATSKGTTAAPPKQ